MFNQAKMAMEMRKIKKELENQIIEVEAGDGAVRVQINGEQKIKKINIDPEMVDLNDIHELERWIEVAIKEAIAKSRELSIEKMKPYMGGLLGGLGM